MPNVGLQLHRATQKVCGIGCMRLGPLDLSMSVVKPALIPEQLREGAKNPKLFIVPIERRRDPEGSF